MALTGLSGAESAYQEGLGGSLNVLEKFGSPGLQAFQLQSALSGAGGRQQQEDAYGNFMSSPGQQFLRDRGEQALLRNASAIGGIGGGNVRKGLVEHGIGMAAQDFGNSWNRLGQVAAPGFAAAQQGADQIYGTGRDIAGARTQAGRDIASNVQGTTSALAQLVNAQGTGLSEIINQGGVNLANMLTGSGTAQTSSNQNLAALLASIQQQGGNTLAGATTAPNVQQTTGNGSGLGDLLGGVGSMLPYLGFAAASDARLKENIERVGQLPSGMPLYRWDWLVETDQPNIGVMAHDVAQDAPQAVTLAPDGYLRVNYEELVNG